MDMAESTLFRSLPTELRLEIWKHALTEEILSRLVISYDTRIIPLRNLISPLLSVSTESRACALRQYDTKVEVYKVPSPKPDEELSGLYSFWKAHKEGLVCCCKEDSCANTPHAPAGALVRSWQGVDFCDRTMFENTTRDTINNVETQGHSAGSVYVSARKDRFLNTPYIDGERYDEEEWHYGNDMLEPFWAKAASILKDEPLQPGRLSWNHITSQLSPRTLGAIQTVVLAEDISLHRDLDDDSPSYLIDYDTYLEYEIHFEPHRYSLSRAKLKWGQATFKGLKFWDHLWFYNGIRSFQEDVARKSIQELDIRRWVGFGSKSYPDSERWIIDLEARKSMVSDYLVKTQAGLNELFELKSYNQ
ncbi:hypothetical protein F5Y18DRAFT_403201 [Xylariaceae sp. FL1019]|nr:hypothetical protein F5Y18DRAFT_403201 [Xylariaceae sp. FL1019]